MLSPVFQYLLLAVLFCCGVCSCASSDVLGVFRPSKPGTSDDLRLQDFCIFRCGKHTYIASMKKDYCSQGILVARSNDMRDWEVLGDAVPTRTPEDAAMVWAPHVVEDGGVYHMFYTGVTVPAKGAWCQRILVASTTDPSKPASWTRNHKAEFLVDGATQSWFRPSHAGAVWTDTGWADCRDPMVLKHRGTWYMFYSGTDTSGGIMGVATAPRVLGPWTDRGAVLRVKAGTVPESCFVLQTSDGGFVVTMNHAGGIGTSTARGKSLLPSGTSVPFCDPRVIGDTTGTVLPGWAHEFIPESDGSLLCAHLTGYYITLRRASLTKETFGWTVNAVSVLK